MDKDTKAGDHDRELHANTADVGPGSETERFNAVVDPRHSEAVTGESGVPRHKRDHELRRQENSLDEFS
jgi:hypothetical protein